MRKTADVIVVGGGIIGCAVADQLARKGAKTVLLERDHIAAGASGRNHGLIWYPQNEVTAPLYRESHAIYRELAGDALPGIGLDDEPRGMLIAVSSQDQWEAAETEAKLSEAGGIRTERLDSAPLRRIEPNLGEHHIGGWLIQDGYRLDPAAACLALALRAREGGAGVETHIDVKQLLVRKDRIAGVATDQGTIAAPTVVVAAGPWAPKLIRSASLDLPITGVRGWLLLTRAVDSMANHLIITPGWHVISALSGEVTLEQYAKGDPLPHDLGLLIQQNRSGHILLGGTRVHSLADEPEQPQLTHQIARRAIETMPRLAGVPVTSTWSGVRPVSPDGLPLIGWMPDVEGLFVAGGHGGQGVMLGGGTGRLAAEMIRGEDPFTDPAPFAPDRLGTGAGRLAAERP